MRRVFILLLHLAFFSFYVDVGRAYILSRDGSVNTWLRRVTTSSSGGSWFWGWAWGADNTVTVVERSPPVTFSSRPASFGHMIEDAIMGYGIPMNAFTVECNEDKTEYERDLGSNLGCPKLCPSQDRLPSAEDAWFAIVQRGQCSFVDKVREAQRFGAKAVVVGGDDPDVSGNPDVLVNMYSQSDSSDVKIPSTFIRFSDYTHLVNLIAVSNTSTSGLRTVSLQITSDYASWEWYSPILTFVILLILPSALTLTTLLIHRCRTARAERRERAPEDIVQSLPWRVWTGHGWEKHSGPVTRIKMDLDDDLEYNAGNENGSLRVNASSSHEDRHAVDAESINPPWFEEQTECAICLTDFVKGDRVRVLPCKHIFHLDEVDEWLIHRKKLCPVCKADVTQPDHPYPDEENEALQPTERTPLLPHGWQSSTRHIAEHRDSPSGSHGEDRAVSDPDSRLP